MQLQSITDVQSSISQILEQIPYLKLLILFGSRARGDNSVFSDWDFALLFDENLRQRYELEDGWNRLRSWVVLQQVLGLGDDEMDWVDLKDASELLAHSIARDGVVIYEREPGIFEEFKKHALMTSEQLKKIRQRYNAEVKASLEQWGL